LCPSLCLFSMPPKASSKTICPNCRKELQGPQGLGMHLRSCTVITSAQQAQNKAYEESEEARYGLSSSSNYEPPSFKSILGKERTTGKGKDKAVHSGLPQVDSGYGLPLLTLASGDQLSKTAIGPRAVDHSSQAYQPPRLKSVLKRKPQQAPVSQNDTSSDSDDQVDVVPSSQSSSSPRVPKRDDIRTEFHPHSKRPPIIEAFEDYGRNTANNAPRPQAHPKPWLPFHSESEFSFAEAVLEVGMSHSQIDNMIDIIRNIVQKGEPFVVKDHRELEQLWEEASDMLAPFTAQDINIAYKNQTRTMEFWSRPLMGWARNIVEDSYLGSICEWDALHLEKFDGKVWIPFVHEPWTATRMWDVQSSLPADGKPLAITLYADKTQLSSFGTAQGYPIMAQINNLPSAVRNGTGLGATQVVGWLPIVAEDESDKGKSFTNFKRAVWHASFKVLLDGIELESYTGVLIKCGDGILRKLYPFVYVLAADYEEQYVN